MTTTKRNVLALVLPPGPARAGCGLAAVQLGAILRDQELDGPGQAAAPLGLALPFLVAGAVKSAYDLALWRLFGPVSLAPELATPVGGTP